MRLLGFRDEFSIEPRCVYIERKLGVETATIMVELNCLTINLQETAGYRSILTFHGGWLPLKRKKKNFRGRGWVVYRKKEEREEKNSAHVFFIIKGSLDF